MLGVAQRKENLIDAAEDSYQAAAKLIPESPEPFYNLAVLYMVRDYLMFLYMCVCVYVCVFKGRDYRMFMCVCVCV